MGQTKSQQLSIHVTQLHYKSHLDAKVTWSRYHILVQEVFTVINFATNNSNNK